MKLHDPLLLQGLAGIIWRLTIVSTQRGTYALKLNVTYIFRIYLAIYQTH